MLGTMRRMFRFGLGNGFALLGAFLVVGYGLTLLVPSPARADATLEKWKSIALSDIAINLRMMAIENLKKDGSEGAVDALADIARNGDVAIQMAACAQLGRVHTSASKAKLKGLLEDGGRTTEVRSAAAACIAEHWRDQGDLSYLEDKCRGNEALSAHCAVIRSRVYER